MRAYHKLSSAVHIENKAILWAQAILARASIISGVISISALQRASARYRPKRCQECPEPTNGQEYDEIKEAFDKAALTNPDYAEGLKLRSKALSLLAMPPGCRVKNKLYDKSQKDSHIFEEQIFQSTAIWVYKDCIFLLSFPFTNDLCNRAILIDSRKIDEWSDDDNALNDLGCDTYPKVDLRQTHAAQSDFSSSFSNIKDVCK